MARPNLILQSILLSWCFASADVSAAPGEFQRLVPVRDARIVSASEAYPGGRHEPTNLLDEDPKTEYSSNGAGTNTFIEVDFGRSLKLAAFRHVDRNDPATIAKSKITLLDESGGVLKSFDVTHANRRAGETFLALGNVECRRARWQVTQPGSTFGTVGGAGLNFYTVGKTDPKPSGLAISVKPQQLLERNGGNSLQPIEVTVDSPYLDEVNVAVRLRGSPVQQTALVGFGTGHITMRVPPVEEASSVVLDLYAGAEQVQSVSFLQKPVRKLLIYLLPHSHVDIGYTARQADVEKKQNDNMETALKLARDTAGFPEGSRFKWNVEVLWPVDNYLRSATPEKKKALMAAIASGQVGLDAFYGNILTGLCRPEELLRMMRYAEELSALCGLPIESAMISDVPGYTWSTVSAMAHAGVKYFSFAPNYFDRMGGTMKEWQNRPFWWQGPDGTNRVLCWCPSRGYALGHLIGDGEALARFMPEYLVELETTGYPYDISHLRWNVHGDNGSPDEKVAEVVRAWNAKYAYPRLVLSTTAEAFQAFEKRYGKDLPVFSGDYTPYWEDGAGSSAVETAMNRASAERLVQAETLWLLNRDAAFPASDFNEAWRNVLLYSEHTWGAHNSVSQPDEPFVRDQWKVKQAFALDADRQSRALLARALEPKNAQHRKTIEVFNTSSWERTDLVTLEGEMAKAGDGIEDERGRVIPSQRLSNGQLAFVAKDVPAFGSKRYELSPNSAASQGRAIAQGNELRHPGFNLKLHEQTGNVKSFYSHILKRELAEGAINEFLYLPGADVRKVERNGVPIIRVKEAGPLVASLVIESAAPGARLLEREIRVIDGLDRVEFINLVDKLPIRSKEAVHFGYEFAVPNAEVRMDVGWAVVRPETDQIPASCKNWFSVQRWVDIANDDFGVTWIPIDAPLVQIGGITANMIGSQTDWRPWIQKIKPSSRIYSWAMNNHWHTNYRADQEGRTTFRYMVRPHRKFDPAEAARFGAECSQPLLVSWASEEDSSRPRLQVSTEDVVVTALKPADQGKGWIVRLYGASGETRKVKLKWTTPEPSRVFLSDLSERPYELVKGAVQVPGWGIVTLRAE